VHTPEGEFVYANQRALELHGYTREEFLALDLHDVDAPTSAELISARASQIAEHGEASFEVEHYRKDGSTFPLIVNARAASWGGREVILSVATDITEKKRVDAKLVAAFSSLVGVVGLIIESRDPYTAGHERRVAELASCIAREMGMSAEHVEEIRIAGLLHDVGKISVPAEILSKPGKLTPIEYLLVKSHAESGHSILCSANIESGITDMVYQHHERCDGSGYPRGLTSDELVDGAKVLMVADVVEAMSTHRPYRPALGVESALAEIARGMGVQYDVEVAEACKGVFDAGFEFTKPDDANVASAGSPRLGKVGDAM
jgi:PAS domain S-box-containing protein/putative nucleotidyltransferase with HDIG domain